jgi:prepilin-type processing-associated H-X9-DG protein
MSANVLDSPTRQTPSRRLARAFTLTELIVVVVVATAAILVLAPSLNAAATRSKTTVCLDNLRSLGLAVRTYAEMHVGTLPGPLHPAVNHDMLRDDNDPAFQYLRERQLVWRLRVALGSAITDRLVTCPVMGEINPDCQFELFYDMTGRRVYPTHYALNSYAYSGGSPDSGTRATNPPFYFGYSSWVGYPTPPLAIGAIPNADREWMVADAWYRPRPGPFLELQQEGPYQYAWSGEAFPYSAPHDRFRTTGYSFTDSYDRRTDSSEIRQRKSDGVTNTLFFDGHAAGVPSRTLTFFGYEILYGFPGTVNPAQENPDASHPVWSAPWR